MFLNGCKTINPLGKQIVKALPHLTVIGWDSVTTDDAASTFALVIGSSSGCYVCCLLKDLKMLMIAGLFFARRASTNTLAKTAVEALP